MAGLAIWRLIESRDPWFLISGAVWVFTTVGFIFAALFGVQSAGLSVVYAAVSTAASFIGSHTIRRDAHAAELAELEERKDREIASLSAGIEERDAQRAGFEAQIQEEKEAKWALHAGSSVRKVFRSQTSFLDIHSLADQLIAGLQGIPMNAGAKAAVREPLLQVRLVASMEVAAAPDMIEAWREISGDAVDKALQEVERIQIERNSSNVRG